MSPLAARVVSSVLIGIVAILSVPILWIAATNPEPSIPVRTSLEAQTSLTPSTMVVVITLTLSLAGAVIVWNRLENGLGWLFAGGGVFAAPVQLSFTYGFRATAASAAIRQRSRPRRNPAASRRSRTLAGRMPIDAGATG